MLKRSKRKLNSDVNLTPLIDIMTSLLAIFMLTAPMMTSGITLDLPKGDGKMLTEQEDILDVSLNQAGALFIGENEVSKDEFIPKIIAIAAQNPELRMMISADKTVPYGSVIEVMSLLRAAGFEKVGLKTDMTAVREETLYLPQKKATTASSAQKGAKAKSKTPTKSGQSKQTATSQKKAGAPLARKKQ